MLLRKPHTSSQLRPKGGERLDRPLLYNDSDFGFVESSDRYTIESRDMQSHESWPHGYGVTDCPGCQLEHP